MAVTVRMLIIAVDIVVNWALAVHGRDITR